VRVNVCVIERHQEAKDEPAGTPVPVRIVRPKGWALGFGGCPGIRCFGLLNNLCSKPFKSQPGWGSFRLSWQQALQGLNHFPNKSIQKYFIFFNDQLNVYVSSKDLKKKNFIF